MFSSQVSRHERRISARAAGAPAAPGQHRPYRFSALTPGLYTVSANLPGFKQAVRTDVRVNIASQVAVPLALEVSGVEEKVTVAAQAPLVDRLVVVGAPNSSNSRRLQEVAERAGCPYAVLVQRAAEIDWTKFEGISSLGVTAGASAPEVLVEEILDAFAARYELKVETVSGADESDMFFPLPRQLRDKEVAA